jgi:hypothetical protein
MQKVQAGKPGTHHRDIGLLCAAARRLRSTCRNHRVWHATPPVQFLFYRTLALRGQLVITLNQSLVVPRLAKAPSKRSSANTAVPHGKAQIALWTRF